MDDQELVARIEQLQAELEAERHQVAVEAGEADRIETVWKERYAAAEADNERMRRVVTHLQAERDEAIEQIKWIGGSFKKDMADLQGQYDELKAENERLQAITTDLEARVREWEVEADSLEAENARLRVVVETARRAAFLYQSRLATDGDLVDQLRPAMRELDNRLRALDVSGDMGGPTPFTVAGKFDGPGVASEPCETCKGVRVVGWLDDRGHWTDAKRPADVPRPDDDTCPYCHGTKLMEGIYGVGLCEHCGPA